MNPGLVSYSLRLVFHTFIRASFTGDTLIVQQEAALLKLPVGGQRSPAAICAQLAPAPKLALGSRNCLGPGAREPGGLHWLQLPGSETRHWPESHYSLYLPDTLRAGDAVIERGYDRGDTV